MADIHSTLSPKRPRVRNLLWPAIVALKEIGGSATNEELLSKVIEVGHIPPEIQNVMHSDNRQTRLGYALAWTRTYLKKIGAIENSSPGVWSITKDGEALTEVDAISRFEKQLEKERRLREEAKASDEDKEELEGDEETLSVDWKGRLLDVLRKLKPEAFERLAQRILRESGFIKVEVTGRVGDGGIDGIGVLRVNLLSFQVLFQCKKYSGSVGASVIRDFRGAMVGRSDKGLIITTGTFTPDAKKEATRDGAPAIDLIDGDLLCDLLQKLKLGVKTELVERMSVDAGWFDGI